MHDSLIQYIKDHSVTPLTESEIEVIKDVFVPKRIRKRQYFLQEGEVCKYSAFIIKGAMRQYSVDDKGVEHIVRLSIENWWVADRESYVMLTPSVYNIDAWEDTDVLLLTRADFLNRLTPIAAINEMTRKMDENYAIASQKRLNATISLSAEQRYSDLAKTYPEFLQRFPQHIIASYLGITKETLSRIRSHAVKK
ncbi:MAG TPA: Crp/Fnr family transcriptional regulator [Chitinophagaceae bacterium]|nr:Crp/Fnr family transcriptional regulator [Chitinophagaceae bacterium]